jgi:hypothetical protein
MKGISTIYFFEYQTTLKKFKHEHDPGRARHRGLPPPRAPTPTPTRQGRGWTRSSSRPAGGGRAVPRQIPAGGPPRAWPNARSSSLSPSGPSFSSHSQKNNNITFRGRGGARRAVPRTENPLQVDRRRGSGAGSFKKQKKGTRHNSQVPFWLGAPPTVFFLKTFENSTQKNIKRTIKFVDFVYGRTVTACAVGQ